MPVNEITDFGQKIGGARKDLRGNMTLDDIRRMTPEERLELVKKNMVWPTPNYDDMVNVQGYTQKAALMIKSLRDSFPTCPILRAAATEAERATAAEMYTCLLNAAKAVAARGKTEAELAQSFAEAPEAKEWLAKFTINQDYPGGRKRANYEAAARFNEAIEGAFGPGCYTESRDMRRAFTCFASAEVDQASLRILKKNPQWPNGATQAESYLRREGVSPVPIGAEGFRIARRGQLPAIGTYQRERLASIGFADEALDRVYATKEEAEAAMLVVAEAHYAQQREGAKAKREALIRRAKGTVVAGDALVDRVGKNWRDGANVTGEDYLRAFGLRGGEFGLWVNQEERQAVLNKGFDSLHDIADVLSLDPCHVSLGGQLSIAFGARGNGGWAAAHYESGRRVINLTKPNGEGCLAHEYFHALDHYLGSRASALGMVTRVLDPEHACYLTNCVLKPKQEGVEEMPEATFLRQIHGAMETISVDSEPRTKADVLAEAKEDAVQVLRAAMIQAACVERHLSVAPWIPAAKRAELLGQIANMRAPEQGKDPDKLLSSLGALVAAPEMSRVTNRGVLSHYHSEALMMTEKVREIEGLPDSWVGEPTRRKTEYIQACSDLDKKRSNPYYQKNHEMFARVGEAVVADELAAHGRANYFLVAGANGEAHPQGKERARFRERFMPLLSRLAEHLPRIAVDIPSRERPPLPQPRAAAMAFKGEQLNLL